MKIFKEINEEKLNKRIEEGLLKSVSTYTGIPSALWTGLNQGIYTSIEQGSVYELYKMLAKNIKRKWKYENI